MANNTVEGLVNKGMRTFRIDVLKGKRRECTASEVFMAGGTACYSKLKKHMWNMRREAGYSHRAELWEQKADGWHLVATAA